jgi:Tol biopolymer transport system component
VFLHTPTQGPSSIGTSNLDGSGFRLLTTATPHAYPTVSPTSDLILYHQYEDVTGPAIFALDASSTTPRRLLGTDVVAYAAFPRVTPDGKFVHFVGGADADYAPITLWRARIDGTGVEQTPSSQVSYWTETQPALSPDGATMVFPRLGTVVQLSLATGQRTVLKQRGQFPSYSPDGQRLAFVAEGSLVVRHLASGASISFQSPVDTFLEAGLTWLADGEWLLLRGSNSPLLVNSITREVVPLPSLHALHQIQVRH